MRDIEAFVAGRTITVDWTNPTPMEGHLLVRYRRGHTAPTRTGGHRVHLGMQRATSATLHHLPADATYTVSVWAGDRGGWSHRRSVRFTTDARASANTASYTGTVTDTAGHPLAHAVVSIEGWDGTALTTATNRAGHYSSALPFGRYFAEIDGANATGGIADATGYAGGFQTFDIASARTVAGKPVALRPGALISGELTDRAGHALGGVSVYTEDVGPYIEPDTSSGGLIVDFVDDAGAQSISDAQGRYVLRGVPRSALRVCFQAPVQTASAPVPDGVEAGCRADTIEAAPGSTVTEPPTTLDQGAGADVHGRVVLPSGRGANGVFISLNSRQGGFGSMQTAADGRFDLPNVPPGRYRLCYTPEALNLTHRIGFRSRCEPAKLVVRAGATSSIRIVLQQGAALTGTVTGAGARPLADVQVELARSYYPAVTDARGQYTLNGLPAGRVRLCFSTTEAHSSPRSTGSRSRCAATKVRTTVGAVRTGNDAQLLPGSAISGHVLDASRHGVRNIDVDVEPVGHGGIGDFADGETTASGRYRIANLSPGKYRVCFDVIAETGPSREYCKHAVSTTAGSTTNGVDEVLPATADVAVRVRDSAGQPIAAADAALLRACTSKDTWECDHSTIFDKSAPVKVVASAVTGGHGRVTLTGLRPGHYALCVFGYHGITAQGAPATGYADTCSSSSTFDVVAVAAQRATVSITLPDAGAVTGVVTDAGGHPLQNALVHVTGSAADDFVSASEDAVEPLDYSTTDADGRYTIRSVAPGMQRVCIDAASALGGTSKAGYLDECIGGTPGSLKGGSRLDVSGDATTNAPGLALSAAAGISGALSAASGKLKWPTVAILDSTGKSAAYTEAASNGRYRVIGLVPGSYYACAEDERSGACYPDAPWNGGKPPKTATPVGTTAGAVTSSIDIVLPR